MEAAASYTLSRLDGNYPALASSDEVARTSPNVTRLFDSLVIAFDSKSNPVCGRLNTDRPHQLKLSGYYQFPTQMGVGARFVIASGIPISHVTNMQSSTPVFYDGRLTNGRTPVYTQVDLTLQQAIRLGVNRSFRLELNAQNLFDQDETVDVFRNLTRDAVPTSNEAFFAGFDINQVLAANPGVRMDPRYLQTNSWQNARAIRLMAKFTF